MSWRLAESLSTLREQINELSPQRSKVSDGTKGDDAHSKRKSDHNPNAKGVVQAFDCTDDPSHGVDNHKLAEALVASRDPRIKYIISDGQIIGGAGEKSAWIWRKYTGANSHHHHVHISVQDSPALYDDARPWDLSALKAPTVAQKQKPIASNAATPVLSRGAKGPGVDKLQVALNMHGAKLKADSDFGDKTEKAVKAFQKKNGLHPDGVVGIYTWEKLLDLEASTTRKDRHMAKIDIGKILDIGLTVTKALNEQSQKGSNDLKPSDVPKIEPAVTKQVEQEVAKQLQPVVENMMNNEPLWKSRVMRGLVGALFSTAWLAFNDWQDDGSITLEAGYGYVTAIFTTGYAIYGRLTGSGTPTI